MTEEVELTLQDLWQILVRGRWLIFLSFVLVVGSTALFTFTARPVYEAEAKLLVEQGQLTSAGELAQLLLNPLTSGGRNALENRIEVLLSRPVLERARQKLLTDPEFVALRRALLRRESLWTRLARTIGLARSHSEPETTLETVELNHDEELLTVEELRGRISAQAARNTDIIMVKAQGSLPQEAQLLANAVVQAYLEVEEEQTKRTISSVKRFLEEQLALSQQRLEATEEQVVEFQKRSGLELGPEGATKNLIELNKLLTQAKIELEDRQGALDAVRQLLADVRQELLDEEATSEDVEALLLELRNKVTTIRKIQGEIADLEDQRAQALADGNVIKAQALENQILQKKKDLEAQGAEQFDILNLLPKYEELIQQELQLTLEIEALRNRIKVIQETMDRETQKLIDNGLELVRLERNLDVDKNIYILLRQEYERARIAEAGEPGLIRLIEAAEEPKAPIKPQKKLNLFLAALLGLTLGTGLAFLREHLDSTLKTAKDVEAAGLVPLGTIVEIEAASGNRGEGRQGQMMRHQLLTSFEPQSSVYDAYLGLKTNLHFAGVNWPIKALVVSSALPEEGKTLTTLNLGLAAARSGQQVLVVDADLRSPQVTKLFGLKGERGLTDLIVSGDLECEELLHVPFAWPEWCRPEPELLEALLVKHRELLSPADWKQTLKVWRREPGRSLEEILVQEGLLSQRELDEVLAEHTQGLDRFFVLPAGTRPPSAAALLSSGHIDQLIEALKGRFDLVLLDSPPVLAAPDTALLGRAADGVLLVIEAERTARRAVEQAREQLAKGDIHVVGGVLNRVRPEILAYEYGYGYGYGRREK
jgi:uncharacterized protein involved in exopolysaccharide biosynthesis/Mrp family chromosome partitioning ATPase